MKRALKEMVTNISEPSDSAFITVYGDYLIPDDLESMSVNDMKKLLIGIKKSQLNNDKTQNNVAKALQIQHDLSLALSSCNDIYKALDYILDAALKVDSIDCGGIYLANKNKGLDLVVHNGLSKEFIEEKKSFPYNSPQTLLARTGKSVYDSYSNILPISINTSYNEHLQAIAVIPVLFQGELLAVLNLASHTHNDIPVNTRNILESIAQQIGSSLIRINADTAMRESQLNLQLLFDTVDDFLFVLDNEGNILKTNSKTCKILGFTQEELQGINVILVHPPNKREEAKVIIAEMLEGKRDFCPIPLMAKDGSLIAVETRVSPGFWDGKPALFGLSRDISARLLAEKALRDSEDRYRQLFESASDALFLIDAKTGMVIDVNEYASELYGYSHDEMLTKRSADLSAEPEITEKLTAEATVDNFKYKISLRYHKKKDGTAFPVEITARSLFLDGLRVIRVACRDITERKKIEDALHNSEIRLREIMENSIDASYKRNCETNNYEYLSPVFSSLTGYTSDEMNEMPLESLFTLIHPDDINNVSEVLNNAVGDSIDNDYQIEYRFKHKDGKYRWLHDKFSIIRNVYNKPIAFIGSVGDITERKLIEEELRNAHWRLESILDGTNAGTWEWNIQTGETIFNEVWANIIGYTLDELQPISINTWITHSHTDDLNKSNEMLNRHFNGEIPYYDIECRMRHKDGHWVWIHDRGRVITYTDDGKPLMMFGTHSDITERKKVEEDLQAALNDVRTLRGIVPICSHCKKIRDDKGYWSQVEIYVRDHTEAEFSHSICPGCLETYYHDIGIDDILEESNKI
jgi:two-component system cell cycle sensor histidine kinase/response regulator CckA